MTSNIQTYDVKLATDIIIDKPVQFFNVEVTINIELPYIATA
jgi:hypothetical protein